MLFYLIIIFFTMVLADPLYQNDNCVLSKTYFFDKNKMLLSFIIIGLVIGLRNGIGIDDWMYLGCYDEVKQMGHTWRDIEGSYVVICKLFQAIGLSGYSVILFYSLMGCFLLGRVTEKLFPSNEWSLVFIIFWSFLFADLFTALRQLVSVGLALNAYVEIKKGKNKLAIVLFALSVLAHYSSIAGILFYLIIPIVKKINSKNKIIILLFFFVLQYIPIAYIITGMVNKIPGLNELYYVKYFLTQGASYLFSEPLGLIAIIMLGIEILLIVKRNSIIDFYNKNEKYSQLIHYDELESLSFLYWSSLMLLNQFGYVRRVSYLLGIFMAAHLSKSIYLFDNQSRRLSKLLIKCFFVIVFCYIVMNYKLRGSTDRVLIPYKSINVIYDLFNS